MEWRGLNSSGSGYKQVVGCSENNNEIWVPKNKGKLLTSWEAISFLRTLLNGQLEYLGPGVLFLTNIRMNSFALSYRLVL